MVKFSVHTTKIFKFNSLLNLTVVSVLHREHNALLEDRQCEELAYYHKCPIISPLLELLYHSIDIIQNYR